MNFKTILVPLDQSERSSVRAAVGAGWSRAHESHLVGLVPTGRYDGVIPADGITTGLTDYIAESADYLRRRAETIAQGFRKNIVRSGSLSYEVRRLTVSPCVAWDGSREAAVALRAALPALRYAAYVTLMSLRHPRDEDDTQRLLAPDMIRFLLRHGVRAHSASEVTGIDIADALLSRISDLGADLLVMGGYNHSRLRERVLRRHAADPRADDRAGPGGPLR